MSSEVTWHKGYTINRGEFAEPTDTGRTVYYTIGEGEWRIGSGPLGRDFRSVAEAKTEINQHIKETS